MIDHFAQKANDWDQPEKIRMSEKFVEELMKLVDIEPQWKAFEIGAGTGLVGLQLLPMLKSCVFEDTSEAMLDVLRTKVTGLSNVEILHGEVSEYTRPDIDLIISNMAFHHIPDIAATLHHLHTITTSGAVVVVSDLRAEDGSFHQFEPIPHRGFDAENLTAIFREAGFQVEVLKTYNILHKKQPSGTIGEYEQFILKAYRL